MSEKLPLPEEQPARIETIRKLFDSIHANALEGIRMHQTIIKTQSLSEGNNCTTLVVLDEDDKVSTAVLILTEHDNVWAEEGVATVTRYNFEETSDGLSVFRRQALTPTASDEESGFFGVIDFTSLDDISVDDELEELVVGLDAPAESELQKLIELLR